MAKNHIDLNAAQKEEVRRLTQFANRRIAAAFKEYEAAGMSTTPREVTGGIQVREQWASEKYAISRSVKFSSQKEYREQLHWLRQFEVMRPSIAEYTEVQREKTLAAVETTLGDDVPEVMQDIIKKMNAPDLSKFWNKFSNAAARLGQKYSSSAAMNDAITEFFAEDKKGLAAGLAMDIKSKDLVKGKKATKTEIKKLNNSLKGEMPKTKKAVRRKSKKAGRKRKKK